MTLCLFYSHNQTRQIANEMRATYHLSQIERWEALRYICFGWWWLLLPIFHLAIVCTKQIRACLRVYFQILTWPWKASSTVKNNINNQIPVCTCSVKEKYVQFDISSKDTEDDIIWLVRKLERRLIITFLYKPIHIFFIYFHITNRIITANIVFYEKPILHFCCFFISTH